MDAEVEGRARRYRSDVAPLWDRRVAEVVVPRVFGEGTEGTVLVAECRTGEVLADVRRTAPGAARVMAVDGDGNLLDLARDQSSGSTGPSVFFAEKAVTALGFADDVFAGAVCVRAFGDGARLRNAVVELGRVVAVGGRVGAVALGAGTASLVLDVLREHAEALGDDALLERLYDLEAQAVTAEDLRDAFDVTGLDVLDAGSETIRVGGDDWHDLLAHPLVRLAVGERVGVAHGPAEWESELAERLRVWLDGYPIEVPVELLWAVGRVREEALESAEDLEELSVREAEEAIAEEGIETADPIFDEGAEGAVVSAEELEMVEEVETGEVPAVPPPPPRGGDLDA